MVNAFEDLDDIDSDIFPTGDDVLEFYDMENAEISDDLWNLVIYWIIVITLTFLVMFLKYRKTVPRLTQTKSSEVHDN